ncbi:unnamed protein product, partial [Choristocarpus tenellus]
RSLVEGVYESISQHLESSHQSLRRLERRMDRDRLTNGTLTEDKEKNLEESRKAYETLLANVVSLSSSLNRDMPDLPEEEEEEEAGGISLWEGGIGEGAGYTGPFEEEERNKAKGNDDDQDGGGAGAGEEDGGAGGEGVEGLSSQLKGLSIEGDGGEGGEEVLLGVEEDEEDHEGGSGAETGETEGGVWMSRNARLMLMLEDMLPQCHNQEKSDDFTVR